MVKPLQLARDLFRDRAMCKLEERLRLAPFNGSSWVSSTSLVAEDSLALTRRSKTNMSPLRCLRFPENQGPK